jgi:hypothetical protein
MRMRRRLSALLRVQSVGTMRRLALFLSSILKPDSEDLDHGCQETGKSGHSRSDEDTPDHAHCECIPDNAYFGSITEQTAHELRGDESDNRAEGATHNGGQQRPDQHDGKEPDR